jgi:hypothetical protein
MYPAAAYGILYEFEDLPDTIELRGPFGWYEANKQQSDPILGAQYIVEVPTENEWNEYRAIKWFPDGGSQNNPTWGIWFSEGPDLETGLWGGQDCLIREEHFNNPLFGYSRDTFEDSYNGQFYYAGGSTGPNWTLTRVSFCAWEGVAVTILNTTFPIALTYDYLSPPVVNSGLPWSLAGLTKPTTNQLTQEIQYHNVPTGVYNTENGDVLAIIS